MPEHVLTAKVEIITDGSHRRRWLAGEKLCIIEETLNEGDDQVIDRLVAGNVQAMAAAMDQPLRRSP